jgi:hypothetical protein
MPARAVNRVSGHSTRVGATQDLAALDIDLAPKIVRRKLALKSVRSYFTSRKRRYAGVVDEQIERVSGKSLNHAARERTDGGLHGKIWTCAFGTCPRIRTAASSAFACVRAGRISSAPWRASASAVSNPMPLFEPVIKAVRPTWEGIFAVVQFVFMGLLLGQ